MNMKTKFLQVLTVVFLVACGSGGGGQALADVTQAAFDALVARVSTVERDVAALAPAPVANVVDANGLSVGEVVGTGHGGSRHVSVEVGSLFYTATMNDAGSWQPVNTYHTEPTCNKSASLLIDARELPGGFDFVFSFNSDHSNWYAVQPVAQTIPGWIREGYNGQCNSIANPRLSFYRAYSIGGTSQFVAPFHIE